MGREYSTYKWEKRNTYRVLVGKPVENKYLEDQDINGSKVLKWISKK
jgi:hypothetical protein